VDGIGGEDEVEPAATSKIRPAKWPEKYRKLSRQTGNSPSQPETYRTSRKLTGKKSGCCADEVGEFCGSSVGRKVCFFVLFLSIIISFQPYISHSLTQENPPSQTQKNQSSSNVSPPILSSASLASPGFIGSPERPPLTTYHGKNVIITSRQ
jgi:hypothetical protein